jgi:hypothetical protein
MRGHSAGVVRNQHPLLYGRQRENFPVRFSVQSSGMSRQEIYGWLAAQNSGDNGFVEVGIG